MNPHDKIDQIIDTILAALKEVPPELQDAELLISALGNMIIKLISYGVTPGTDFAHLDNQMTYLRNQLFEHLTTCTTCCSDEVRAAAKAYTESKTCQEFDEVAYLERLYRTS